MILIAPFVLGLSPALSADLISSPLSGPNLSWTGGYVGAAGGYGWGNAHHRLDDLDVTISNRVNGSLFGFYGGYNYQFDNNVVLGIETDFTWSGQEGGPDGFVLCTCSPPNYVSADLEWNASLRGRLGLAVDRFLPYLSGGMAIGRIRGLYDYVNVDGEINETATGWTLGAGIEYAAAANVTLRFEYRFSDFGSVARQPFLPAFANEQTLRLTSRDLRVGIAYRF
ncbi:outer membrane protein [Mesorhizobium sp. GbtcB19]|uniref:outer membrane protein n=1 Tax=Mesorhizobium sp. GbtcB19 TaxID=2824764 RepID=UPI001C30115F|nr:outer membrane protein [Mesorhizobium sp. GbtcB19]